MSSDHTSSRRRLAYALLVLATLASLAASVWFAKHRMEGYAFRLASYVSIYHPAEVPTIPGFGRVAPGELEVVLSEAPAGRWEVRSGDAARGTPEGRGMRLELAPGLNDYELEAHGPSDPPGRPRVVHAIGPPGTLFSTPDLAVGRFQQYSWSAQTYHPDQYPEAHVAQVRELLAPAGILPADGTLARMEKLWKLLQPRLAARSGEPPPWLRERTAFEQYEALMSGEVRGWCSSFAAIYSLFGTVAGIPIRTVDSVGDRDGVSLSAHAFNEVYLPELGEWAYSDTNLGILHVRDAGSGRYMNTVQLVRAHEAGALTGLVARVLREGELVDVPYAEASRFAQVNLNPNATFVFQRFYADRTGWAAFLHRYLLHPELAYRMYGDNGPHHRKLAAFYASVLLGLVWVALVSRRVLRRGRRDGSPAVQRPAD